LTKPISRRKLISTTLGTVAGSLAIRSSSASPNEKVTVAVVGVNGRGNTLARYLAKRSDTRISALCDVDQSVLERAAQTVRKFSGDTPKLVADFRHLLDDKSIDGLVLATPHHWHVPMALPALAAGKDLYIEKPASHVFQEGRLLIEAAKKHNRIVQHGGQTRSSKATEKAAEILASGLLGEIKMTKAWNIQRIQPLQPKPDSAPPPGVDYEMWLGPAPRRLFNPNRFHRTWRPYRDYGNGDLGDDGAHDIDIARWALGVKTHPVRITAHGSTVDLKGEREFPDNMMIAYHYPEGKVLLYEDRLWTPYGMHGFDSGNAFYGTEGYMIFSRRGYFQVYLGKKDEKGPGIRGGPTGDPEHMYNFVDCVRSRKQTVSNAEVAHLSCALSHLGEIGCRVGRVLHFDPESEKFHGDSEADARLTKEYREPWSVPDPV
jgi:predicted dehydrogenase